MANVNNIFSGVVCAVVVWGLFYLFYPTIMAFADGMPNEIRIFGVMVFLGVLITGGLALPLLMVISDDRGEA